MQYSSAKKQQDSRDKLLQQLQKEVEELRQNDKDYSDLNFLLTNLEHRYHILQGTTSLHAHE